MIVTGPEVVEWARQRFDIADFGPAVGIGWKPDEFRAACIYNGYTKSNICMHIISDGSRKWMTRAYLKTCFEYPFNQLGVKRVTGIVDSTNTQALRFDEHLGFRREAVMKDAGEGDLIVLCMYRDECRFLR